MASDVPADATAMKMAGLAKERLASDLGVAAGQIALSAVEPVQWRDASLGCPKPGVDYIPMSTPGYRISFEVGGATYEYHADREGRVIQCRTTQP